MQGMQYECIVCLEGGVGGSVVVCPRCSASTCLTCAQEWSRRGGCPVCRDRLMWLSRLCVLTTLFNCRYYVVVVVLGLSWLYWLVLLIKMTQLLLFA